MKAVTDLLFRHMDRQAVEREVEEELRFHLDLLEEHFQQTSSLVDARDSALRRFGNVEEVKDECVEISKRKRPFTRALKSFLTLAFLSGVFVCIFGNEMHVVRVGHMLITVAVIGRLLLYVRALNPSSFRPKSDTSSSPLMLDSKAKTPASLFKANNL